jgi:hypothetical protein
MAALFSRSSVNSETQTAKLSLRDRRIKRERDLRFYTNTALLTAVGIGVAIILFHSGAVTASLTAFGASIGLGAVLGFLFGVPAAHRPAVSVSNAGTVTAGTGVGATVQTIDVGQGRSPGEGTPPAPPSQEPVQPAADSSNADKPIVALQPQTQPTNGTALSPGPTDPSNLEQVADWVTKLLLGGGLTQMQRIPPEVWKWANLVALGILRDSPSASPQLILAQQAFAAGLLVYGYVLGFFGGFLITKLQLGTAIV